MVTSAKYFERDLPKYPIKDIKECITSYKKNDNAVQIDKFNYLSVFEIRSEGEGKSS